jgi:2-polyprenyl-6-methoxyphenol hydroxylase-like FAD-dependent oxidoreductase
VKILIVGAGPAGLYLGYLIRRQQPDAAVRIVEQNPPDSTFGFGVVFSERALEFLREDDGETYDLITPAMETWTDLTVVHRGERIRVDGIGFAAIGRLDLLRLLRRRTASAGVAPEFGRAISSREELAGYDLVVGADGVNSFVRGCHADRFGATLTHLKNKFAWYGTTKGFDTLTQTFVATEEGHFNAHHYRHAPGMSPPGRPKGESRAREREGSPMSTFVFECDPATWERVGFGALDDAATMTRCGQVFAETLDGHALVSNRSVWRNFPIVRNERWSVDNVALVGDALHTAHFSIGSGTRLAMEDVIALALALRDHPRDVRDALAAYEAARRPIVEKLVAAASASGEWYERFPEHMRLPPWAFAMSYIQRSGRIDRERLRKLSPRFVAGYEAAT